MNMIMVARINRNKSVMLRLRRYFTVTEPERALPLWYFLKQRGLWQADLVLALLRLNDRASRLFIAELIGHPITICPPRKRGDPILLKEKKARIRWVVKTNPRHPNTRAHERFEIFRAGRTIDECLSRGCTPRDIRQATRRGWIHVDQPQEPTHVTI